MTTIIEKDGTLYIGDEVDLDANPDDIGRGDKVRVVRGIEDGYAVRRLGGGTSLTTRHTPEVGTEWTVQRVDCDGDFVLRVNCYVAPYCVELVDEKPEPKDFEVGDYVDIVDGDDEGRAGWFEDGEFHPSGHAKVGQCGRVDELRPGGDVGLILENDDYGIVHSGLCEYATVDKNGDPIEEGDLVDVSEAQFIATNGERRDSISGYYRITRQVDSLGIAYGHNQRNIDIGGFAVDPQSVELVDEDNDENPTDEGGVTVTVTVDYSDLENASELAEKLADELERAVVAKSNL